MSELTTSSDTPESEGHPVRRSAGIGWLVLAVVLYGALTLPFVSRLGAGFDEVADVTLANIYNSDWLVGPSYIPCQMRLPMYLTALVSNGGGRHEILASRWISTVTGALAVLGMFLYGRRAFGVAGGAIGSLALATSPFFLSYARVGLTESGVYEACAFIWLLYGATCYRQTRSVAWLGAAGVAAGLAIASKFTAVIGTPCLLLVVLLASWRHPRGDMPSRARRIGWILIGGLTIVCAAPYAAAFILGADWSQVSSPLPFAKGVLDYYHEHFPRAAKLLHYLFAELFALALGAWCVVNRGQRAGIVMSLAVGALGACVGFYIIVPPHLVNPELVWGIVDRLLVASAEQTLHLRIGNMWFYFFAMLFKPGPLIGALCMVAPFIHLALRTRGLHVLSYVALLFSVWGFWTIDSSQAFYIQVPFVVSLGLLAGLVARLLERRRALGIAVIAILICQVAFDLCRSFPDYHLNGYQYVGECQLKKRWSMGYNGVVTLPSDGLEQCLRRALKEAPKDATVWVYYAWTPEQVVAWVLHGTGMHYVMGTQHRSTRAPADADYVVIGLEMDVLARGYGLENLPDGWRMVDREWLKTRFEKIYSVDRAFGLEVASLWRRRPAPTEQTEGGNSPRDR